MGCPHIYNSTVDDDNTGANGYTDWHNRILGTSLVEILGQRPRSCIGVERLNGCTGPGRVTVAVSEKLAVAGHDGDHDSVIDKAAEYSPVDLGKEHGARRNLDYNGGLASGPVGRRKDYTYGIHPSSGHCTS